MVIDWPVLLRTGEVRGVDFKGPLEFADPHRASLAADIVALGNTRDGGMLVVGVRENDAREHVVEGLSDEQAASFEVTKITAYVNGYFQPNVELTVEKERVDGKLLVVLRAAEFESTPYICVKDGPPKQGRPDKRVFYAGNLLIRSDQRETRPVQTADEMRDLVRTAVAKRSDDLMSEMRRIIEGRLVAPPAPVSPEELHAKEIERWLRAVESLQGEVGPYGRFSVDFLPEARMDQSAEPDPRSLRDSVSKSFTRFAGWDFPVPTDSTARGPLIEGRLAERDRYGLLWQFHNSGAFFFTGTLLEDSPRWGEGRGQALAIERVAGYVASALVFGGRLYETAGYKGAVVVTTRFHGSAQRHLVSLTHRYFPTLLRAGQNTTGEDFVARSRTSAEDLRSGWEGVATEQLMRFFASFGFEDARRAAEAELAHIKSGKN